MAKYRRKGLQVFSERVSVRRRRNVRQRTCETSLSHGISFRLYLVVKELEPEQRSRIRKDRAVCGSDDIQGRRQCKVKYPTSGEKPLKSLKQIGESVLSALVDEASALEVNKPEAFSKDLLRREEFRSYIQPLKLEGGKFVEAPETILVGQENLEPLQKFLTKLQSNFEEKNLSNLNIATTGITSEVARVLWEMFPDQKDLVHPTLHNFEKLEKATFTSASSDADKTIEKIEYKKLSSALLLVAMDQMMDFEGVSRKSALVPIGPYKYPNNVAEKAKMPASQYFSFGGILSNTAAKQAFETGI